MGLTISIILVLLGFYYKNNKKIVNLQFLWIWILISFNNGGVDYEGYLGMFKTFSSNLNFNFFLEGRLYWLGSYLFNKMNFSFEVYTIVTTTIALSILYYLIKKYSLNFSFVNSCLILYPLVDNIIQKRNFLSMTAILYGMSILISKKKYYIFKYFFLVFIAYHFHVLGIVYILFVIIPYFSLKSIKIISYIGLVIMTMISFKLNDIAKILFFFVPSKVNLYFEDLSGRLPFIKVLFFVFIHLLMFWFVLFFYKKLKNKDNFSISILKINYLFLTIIPLYYYNSTFLRFYRNIFLLNYIFIGNCVIINKFENKSNKFLQKIFIIYVIGLSMTYMLLGNFKYKGLVEPLFKNNYIINFLESIL